NAWFTDFRWRHIGRIDAKSGEVKMFEIPATAKVVAPRRGMMDAKDRLWFAQYRGDKIAVLDTKTGQFRDWAVGPRWSSPYDVMIDKNEEAWTGSMITDQVTRLDTRTGQSVDYLLPRPTNIRRVYVDHATLDNRVLESFGRTAQHRCRLGLVERNLHARGLRVVHALVVDQEAVVVDDRDRHAPAVLLRLRGRAGRDFLGQVDADLLPVGG